MRVPKILFKFIKFGREAILVYLNKDEGGDQGF